jgi:hypothetical protein
MALLVTRRRRQQPRLHQQGRPKLAFAVAVRPPWNSGQLHWLSVSVHRLALRPETPSSAQLTEAGREAVAVRQEEVPVIEEAFHPQVHHQRCAGAVAAAARQPSEQPLAVSVQRVELLPERLLGRLQPAPLWHGIALLLAQCVASPPFDPLPFPLGPSPTHGLTVLPRVR